MQPAKDIYGQDKGHMGQGREAASSVQAQQVSAKAIAARKTGQYTKNSVRSQFWDLAFMSKMGQRIEIEIDKGIDFEIMPDDDYKIKMLEKLNTKDYVGLKDMCDELQYQAEKKKIENVNIYIELKNTVEQLIRLVRK